MAAGSAHIILAGGDNYSWRICGENIPVRPVSNVAQAPSPVRGEQRIVIITAGGGCATQDTTTEKQAGAEGASELLV